MDKKSLFFEITKRNDEDQTVEGIASTETVDSDGEVAEYEAIKEALPEFMKYGNLREMHQLKAAGVVFEATPDDATRTIRIKAKVVDKDAWLKVKEGVYKGFSIGGRALQRLGNRIKKFRFNEISLVDRPANPDALITLFKADAAFAEGGFKDPGQLADGLISAENVLALIQKASSSTTPVRPQAGAQRERHMKKLSKKDAEERMKAFKKKADEEFDKAVSKAADDMDEEACDKAMADIFSPNMFSVPEQKAAGATVSQEDLLKALGVVAGAKNDQVAKADASFDVIKAMAGAIVGLNTKLDEMSKVVQPAKAAAKDLVTKADDSKQAIAEGEPDKDALKKAIDAKDPIAALRVIHQAGGKLETMAG